ncbi:MAG: hypothetical protein N3D10_02640 [Candidatus Micrarchaeota archaeon]|nr:hypothetical protein [Candidatus Micrarchaeota archaeon]
MRQKRIGQLSVESTIIFIVVLITLAAVILFLPLNFAQLAIMDDRKIAQQTVEKLAKNSDLAYLFGEGYAEHIKILIPPSIDYEKSYIGSSSYINDWNLKKEIRITLKDGQVFSKNTIGPVCGNFPTKIGESEIKIEYNTTDVPHIMINSNC